MHASTYCIIIDHDIEYLWLSLGNELSSDWNVLNENLVDNETDEGLCMLLVGLFLIGLEHEDSRLVIPSLLFLALFLFWHYYVAWFSFMFFLCFLLFVFLGLLYVIHA